MPVNPDALFGLVDRGKPEGANASYFFLEIVRSRESEYERGESNFVRKMRAFAEYYAGGRHRERYGIANFRVITVTPTKQRALNLCEKLRDAGFASKRFWFASIEHISPDDPTKMLEQIFCTPKDFEQGTLYSFRHQLSDEIDSLIYCASLMSVQCYDEVVWKGAGTCTMSAT